MAVMQVVLPFGPFDSADRKLLDVSKLKKGAEQRLRQAKIGESPLEFWNKAMPSAAYTFPKPA